MGASLVRRTVEDTNFITVWVIGAFLVFELSVYRLDLQTLFDGWALFTPMIAIILGLLPGCGAGACDNHVSVRPGAAVARIGNTVSLMATPCSRPSRARQR